MEERIPCDYDIHCWIRPLTLTMSINLINSKLHDQFQLKIEHQGTSAFKLITPLSISISRIINAKKRQLSHRVNAPFKCLLKSETRMHSSRMRTVRCSSRLLGGGVCLGGVCLERWVSAQGEGVFAWEGGVSAQRGCLPSACWDTHPPVNRMTDRQV